MSSEIEFTLQGVSEPLHQLEALGEIGAVTAKEKIRFKVGPSSVVHALLCRVDRVGHVVDPRPQPFKLGQFRAAGRDKDRIRNTGPVLDPLHIAGDKQRIVIAVGDGHGGIALANLSQRIVADNVAMPGDYQVWLYRLHGLQQSTIRLGLA